MLPNHSPLVVAEQFGTQEALHPGRIDLGVGRAPGTDPTTARLLHTAPEAFPHQLVELVGCFDGAETDALQAISAPGNRPAMWLLGSNSSSAKLAGRLGLPSAFAHHINPDAALPALEEYRAAFEPSAIAARPYVIVATLVIAADTQEKADWLSSSWRLMLPRFHGLAGEEIRFDVRVVVSNSIGLLQSSAECRRRRL